MISEEAVKKIIGKNIRYYRKESRLLQHELAILALEYPNTPKGRKAGQTLISNIERGRQMPNIIELYLIATTLHTSFEKIIGNSIPRKNIH